MTCKHHFVFTQGHFYCTKCGQRNYGKGVNQRKKQRKAVIPAIAIPIAVVFFLFLFPGSDLFENAVKNEGNTLNSQVFQDCTMTTFGTKNADVICGTKTFHLVRDLPLKAAQVSGVTLEKQGNLFNLSFETNLGVPVQYQMKTLDYQHEIYEDLINNLDTDNSKIKSIEKTIDSISDSVSGVPLMVENIIKESKDSVYVPIEIPKIPQIELPKPPPELSLAELRQIALDDINKYRKENGVRTISLGSAVSPQLYAQELAKEGCIHHVSNSGEGPMLRYQNNGDRMFLVFENLPEAMMYGINNRKFLMPIMI